MVIFTIFNEHTKYNQTEFIKELLVSDIIPLGPFQLLRPLARGGMAEVWEARHSLQKLPVAVKFMTGDLLQLPMFRHAFRTEVRAVAGLDHPNIVMVFDYGEVDNETENLSDGLLKKGTPFLVMELATRGSLTQMPKIKRWEELKNILLVILDGLTHAHARNIIHLDLKPANILVSGDNDLRPGLKVSDFGIAHIEGTSRVMDQDPLAQIIGKKTMMGTPPYMAPEQFECALYQYGPWTDLYALGCMAYSWVYGNLPFEQQDHASLMFAHMYQEPPHLPPLFAVPVKFEAWIRLLLAKEPLQRFQSAADAAWALMNIIGGSDETFTFPSTSRNDSTDQDSDIHQTSQLSQNKTSNLSIQNTKNLGNNNAFKTSINNINKTEKDKLARLDSSADFQGLEEERTAVLIDIIQNTSKLHTLSNVAETLEETYQMLGSVFIVDENKIDAESNTLKIEKLLAVYNLSSKKEPKEEEPKNNTSYERQLLLQELLVSMRSMKPPFPLNWKRETYNITSWALWGVGQGLYGLRVIPLVGRDNAFDTIWKELYNVYQLKTAKWIAIRGPSGIGKSRLVESVLERASEIGVAHIMKTKYTPVTGELYGIKQMLISYLKYDYVEDSDAWEYILRRFATIGIYEEHEISKIRNWLESSTSSAKNIISLKDQYAMMFRIINCLSLDRPVILWFDDVQWGSEALGFVEFVQQFQAITPTAVLGLLTIQEEALAECNVESAILDRLYKKGTKELQIESLTIKEQSDLVHNLLGLEALLAGRVASCTSGNPLFAIQLVGDWVQRDLLVLTDDGFQLKPNVAVELPDSLHQVWSERMETVLKNAPEDSRDMIEIAAVLGMEIYIHEWKWLCNRLSISFSDTFFDTLMAQHLVIWLKQNAELQSNSLQRCSFVHGMLRESVVRWTRMEGKWKKLNILCTEMIHTLYGQHLTPHLSRLATYYIEAEDHENALPVLYEAAQSYKKVSNYPVSERLILEYHNELNALNLPSNDIRWGKSRLSLIETYRSMGRFTQAENYFNEFATMLQNENWESLRPHLFKLKGHLAFNRGQPSLAVEDLVKAYELFKNVNDLHGQADTLRLKGLALIESDKKRAIESTQRALDIYIQLDDTPGQAHCHRMIGATSSNKEMLQKALQMELSLGNNLNVAINMRCLGYILFNEKEPQKGQEFFKKAIDILQSIGATNELALTVASLAELLRAEGNIEESEACYQKALAWMDNMGLPLASLIRVNYTYIAISRKAFSDALEMLNKIEDFVLSTKHNSFILQFKISAFLCNVYFENYVLAEQLLSDIEELSKQNVTTEYYDIWPIESAGDLFLEKNKNFFMAKRTYILAITLWNAHNLEKAAESEKHIQRISIKLESII